MAILEIKYVNGETAAFTIYDELYYIKTGPDIPMLFDRKMKKLLIPNVDSWLQAQTQQRYSFRGLRDMMEAFAHGLEHSYARDDLKVVCEHIFNMTRDYIFKTEYTRSYAIAFKVELMNPKQIPKLTRQIKDNFDNYRKRFGNDRFYLYLCRIWQFCNYHDPSESAVVESLIRRMDKRAEEPTYPMVENEAEIKNHVITKTLGSDLAKFKGIDEQVVENVNGIQSNKL